MSNLLVSKHDSLFKKFLGDLAVARYFLEVHLPSQLSEHCDFTTLAMASGSFIEEDLRTQCSDMLYTVQTTSGMGYIYCLIEHQSRPEKLMAFRLLRYCVAAMQQHLEQGNKQLPVVIPLLFYHGRTSPYPYSPTGWIALPTQNWQNRSITRHSRWSISPPYRITKYCFTGVLHCLNLCKNTFAPAICLSWPLILLDC